MNHFHVNSLKNKIGNFLDKVKKRELKNKKIKKEEEDGDDYDNRRA